MTVESLDRAQTPMNYRFLSEFGQTYASSRQMSANAIWRCARPPLQGIAKKQSCPKRSHKLQQEKEKAAAVAGVAAAAVAVVVIGNAGQSQTIAGA